MQFIPFLHGISVSSLLFSNCPTDSVSCASSSSACHRRRRFSEIVSAIRSSPIFTRHFNMNVTAAAAAAVSSGHNVFVYGSLLADEVVGVLLKRVPQSSPAILHDFHRFSIKGRVYPAILPVEKESVNGRVLMGITDPELYILDTFEDVEYERRDVEVALVEGSEKLKAATYVWCNSSDPDLYGEWNFEEWKKTHMEDFIKMTAGFMEELELPDSKTRITTYETFYQKDG